MQYQAVNFAAKFARIPQPWQPRVIAEMNDYQFKLARLDGEFIWHHHAETDEAFIVLAGTLRIEMRDGAVRLGPRGVRNTGETGGDRTAPNDVWV